MYHNLYSSIYVTEKYAFQENIKAVLFNASVSAHTGFEFPEYVASKAGILGYMKNVACRLVKYKATCNSISCGGVITELNKPVIDNKKLWDMNKGDIVTLEDYEEEGNIFMVVECDRYNYPFDQIEDADGVALVNLVSGKVNYYDEQKRCRLINAELVLKDEL